MKRLVVASLAFSLSTLVACGSRESGAAAQTQKKAADFHIAVVVAPGPGGFDASLASSAAVARLGIADEEGTVVPVAIAPDDAGSRAVASRLEALSEDPLLKAVIAVPALPGTAEGFSRLRAARPELLLLAALSLEEPLVIESASDAVVGEDVVSDSYAAAWIAKRNGASALIYFPYRRELPEIEASRRAAVMAASCGDLGLDFVSVPIPDGARKSMESLGAFFSARVSEALGKYGQETAFFGAGTDDAAYLIRDLVVQGGLFVGTPRPSAAEGYPAGLGLDLGGMKAPAEALEVVRASLVSAGAPSRFVIRSPSTGYSVTVGLVEYALRVAAGAAGGELETLEGAFHEAAGATGWRLRPYTDARTGAIAKNHFVFSSDPYIIGAQGQNVSVPAVDETYYRLTSED